MKNITACLVAISLFSAPIEPVYASEAQSFLEELAGEYRGRGSVTVGLSEKEHTVSCKVNNSLKQEKNALEITGKCATTQGKVDVDGALKVNGQAITGSFISTSNNSEITKQSTTFRDGTLTLSMYMVNKKTGGLSRTKQVVSKNKEGGFKSVFYSYDRASKSFRETGSVNFLPKK